VPVDYPLPLRNRNANKSSTKFTLARANSPCNCFEYEALHTIVSDRNSPATTLHYTLLIFGSGIVHGLGIIRGRGIGTKINVGFSIIRSRSCCCCCWSWNKIRIVESSRKSIVAIGVGCRCSRSRHRGRRIGRRFFFGIRNIRIGIRRTSKRWFFLLLGKFYSKGGTRTKAIRNNNFINSSIRSLYVNDLSGIDSIG
jgi:hypothetical protein